MRCSLRWSRSGLAVLALLIGGCGDPFAAPTRSRSTAKVGGSEVAKPRFLVYVVPGTPNVDQEVWGMRAQHEANDKHAIFRIMGPGPTDTSAMQPEIVRKAVADGASALLVVPGDSPELPKALAEAESRGVPVILIDKGVVPPEGSKPFTVVEHAAFEDTARQIVAATIEDLKKAKQPTDGTALILVDKIVDSTSARRIDALKAAAGAAKFRQVVTVDFDGSKPDDAKKGVLAAVKANPEVSVVLAEDGEGLIAGAKVRSEALGKPIFFVGGYLDYRGSTAFQAPSRESCHVEGRYAELGALAVLSALARLRGETVAERIYLPSKFTRTEGAVSSPETPNSSFPTVVPTRTLMEAGRDQPSEPAKEAKKP